MIAGQRVEGDASPGRPPLIAVVDDDASFVRSLRRLLRLAGYEVQTFGTAREFLDSLERTSPHCLLLDVHMPQMSGLALQDWLEKAGRPLPVILMTAYDTPQTREHAARMGCFGLLLKPFEESALLEAIAKAVADNPGEGLVGSPG